MAPHLTGLEDHRLVVAEDAALELACPDEVALDDHLGVVAQRFVDGRGQLTSIVDQGHAHAAAQSGGFDDTLLAHRRLDVPQHALGRRAPRRPSKPGVIRNRQTVAAHQVLEHDLVHGHRAGEDAGSGVGNARHLQEPLQRAVLTEGPMHGQEGDVNRLRQRAQRLSRLQRAGVIVSEDREAP